MVADLTSATSIEEFQRTLRDKLEALQEAKSVGPYLEGAMWDQAGYNLTMGFFNNYMEEFISGVAREDPKPRRLRRRQHRGAGDLLEEVLSHRGGQLKGAGGEFDPVQQDCARLC